MRKINDILNKSLKVIITIMIVFSSMLVVNPSPIFSEEMTEEEKNELVEEVVENKEELSNETIEEVKEEIEKVDEEVVGEAIDEEIVEVDNVKQKLLLTTEPKYTVTFKNNLRTINTIEVEAGSTITTVPNVSYEDKSAFWYKRTGGIIGYKEELWDFNTPVNENLTLYVKFKNIGADGDFHFRVKHEKSNELDEGQYNTGSYTYKDTDGYTYSYYKYETNIDFSYTEGQTDDFYKGTSFDLAIQESNPGDTIEILKNFDVSQPITIWANVNLNLNNKTITYNANIIQRLINFINYLWKVFTRSDRKILPTQETFNPAIFVYNSTITISNGTIRNNAGGTGHGIVVYSELEKFVTTLKNITVVATSGADAIDAGYAGEIIDGELKVPTNAKGHIVINSGYFNGGIHNYNTEGSLIINNGNFTKNPIENTQAVLGTDKYLYVNNNEIYKYGVGDYNYQAVIVDQNGVEIANKTFVAALNDAESGQTIKIVKDITLEEDLTINLKGRNLIIDIYGHNITTNNNSKILIDDTLVNKGKVEFINSDDYFNGKVDTIIEATNGTAIIKNGYYNSAIGDNMNVQGGYFVNEVSSNSLFNENYECYELDQVFLQKYKYKVVEKNKKIEAKIGEKEYTSFVTAIKNAKTGDTINILQSIELLEPVEISKSLTINLPENLTISSYALKSFVITGTGTVVIFKGTGNTSKIINKVKANNEQVVIFEIQSADQSVVQSKTELKVENIAINAKTQGCGEKELIAFNTRGNNATLSLNSTRIDITDTESQNKNIYAIKNNSNGAKISVTNDTNITMKPSNGGSFHVYGIYNDGNESVININSSYIELRPVENMIDYVDLIGIYDNSNKSTITLNGSEIAVTNNNGSSLNIDIESNSTLLSVVNGSYLGLSVKYDGISGNRQAVVSSKGKTEIVNSEIIATSSDNNVIGVNVDGGYAELYNDKVTTSSPKNSYCISGSNGSTTYVYGEDGYYYSSNPSQIVRNDNSKIYILDGHFYEDVTNLLERGYICANIPASLSKRVYDYDVNVSNCGLAFTVANDGTFVINYLVTFDDYMTEHPEKYGVRFLSDSSADSSKNEFVELFKLSIADTKKADSLSNDKIKYEYDEKTNTGIYSFSIVARLMNTNIGVEIIDLEAKDANQKEHVYHKKNAYSVKEYYYTILSSQNEDESYVYEDAARDLAAAALNYGSYCQETLEQITDENLVNAEIEQFGYTKGFDSRYDAEIKNQKESENTTGNLVEQDFMDTGHSLLLEESITLRYRFNLKSGENINDYEAYYRDASQPGSSFISITPSRDIKTYYLDIPEIKPYNFGKIFELKIVKGDETSIITYRPLDYIIKGINKGIEETKEDLVELARALYTYYKIASIYYGDKK